MIFYSLSQKRPSHLLNRIKENRLEGAEGKKTQQIHNHRSQHNKRPTLALDSVSSIPTFY